MGTEDRRFPKAFVKPWELFAALAFGAMAALLGSAIAPYVWRGKCHISPSIRRIAAMSRKPVTTTFVVSNIGNRDLRLMGVSGG
jgi:hypothetical protein